METIVWIGAAITLAGFAGIVLSLVLVLRARREGLDDDALRARLHKVLPINMGALLMSFIGLGMVATGLLLG